MAFHRLSIYATNWLIIRGTFSSTIICCLDISMSCLAAHMICKWATCFLKITAHLLSVSWWSRVWILCEEINWTSPDYHVVSLSRHHSPIESMELAYSIFVHLLTFSFSSSLLPFPLIWDSLWSLLLSFSVRISFVNQIASLFLGYGLVSRSYYNHFLSFISLIWHWRHMFDFFIH